MNKLKIISGGQTGADLAGLWAAKLFGIQTGGMAPHEWKTQLGSRPQLAELFGLQESEKGYRGRTLENCENSDLTIIFAANIRSPGTKLTLHYCTLNGIRYRVFPFHEGDITSCIKSQVNLLSELIKHQLMLHELTVINIAGNSSSSSASSFTFTFLILCQALEAALGIKPNLQVEKDIYVVEAQLRDRYDNAINVCEQ